MGFVDHPDSLAAVRVDRRHVAHPRLLEEHGRLPQVHPLAVAEREAREVHHTRRTRRLVPADRLRREASASQDVHRLHRHGLLLPQRRDAREVRRHPRQEGRGGRVPRGGREHQEGVQREVVESAGALLREQFADRERDGARVRARRPGRDGGDRLQHRGGRARARRGGHGRDRLSVSPSGAGRERMQRRDLRDDGGYHEARLWIHGREGQHDLPRGVGLPRGIVLQPLHDGGHRELVLRLARRHQAHGTGIQDVHRRAGVPAGA